MTNIFTLGNGKTTLRHWPGAVMPGRGGYRPGQSLLDKLQPANNRNLGSTRAGGADVPTRLQPRAILDVVNTYLIRPLTSAEMREILDHREQFVFTIGVGDRRKTPEWIFGRFRLANNWRGEDVQNRILTPDPFDDPPYRHTLTFSGRDGTLKITDTHSSPNTYGSIRYLTVRKK